MVLAPARLKKLLTGVLSEMGERQRVLVVPPDQTRIYSRAGRSDALRIGAFTATG